MRKVKVGDYTYIGNNCSINNVEIGKYCSISKNVNIGLGTHPINYVSTSPIFFSPNNGTGYRWVDNQLFDDSPAKVIIGNDVWIGMNVTIMGGVVIGTGAIIGSHALVTKDINPYEIVGGVPAKVIRKRFDDNTVEELLNSAWWNFDEKVLKDKLAIYGQEVNKDVLEQINKL